MRRILNQLASLKLALGLILGLCSLILSLTLAAPGLTQASNSSTSVEDLQKQKQAVETKRSTVQQQQTRLKTLEQSAQNRLGGLQDNIKVTTEQLSKTEKQLQTATDRLKALETDLAKAEKKYQRKQFATVARLRFMQRQQGSRGWAVLLQSQNLNEFLDRRHQLLLIYQSDRQILANLKADTDAIEQQRRGVEQQKNEVALRTQELLADKAEYQAQAQSQQTMIVRLRQDRKALEAAEDQLAKDSDSLATLIQQRLAVSGYQPSIRGTGLMSYPCNAPVTSGFGYRMHPILGYTRFHSGIDFGADYGTPIRAANAGTVIFAGWYGGYGRAVIIDHGNNLTTLYGHTSEIYVSEGQTVQRGQVIAAVGSTGLSTGPHLHFEVRVGGEPVNPASYL